RNAREGPVPVARLEEESHGAHRSRREDDPRSVDLVQAAGAMVAGAETVAAITAPKRHHLAERAQLRAVPERNRDVGEVEGGLRPLGAAEDAAPAMGAGGLHHPGGIGFRHPHPRRDAEADPQVGGGRRPAARGGGGVAAAAKATFFSGCGRGSGTGRNMARTRSKYGRSSAADSSGGKARAKNASSGASRTLV